MDATASFRRSAYVLLAVVTVAGVIGRVLNVERVYEPSQKWPAVQPRSMPTFSSNDRSRWATIRALVDEGTFAIGHREYDAAGKYRDIGIVTEDGWGTVDKVLHPDTKVFYSSKPPLMPVAVAGEYWLLKTLFGWTLTDQPSKVVIATLITVNVLPLFVYLLLLSRVIDRFGATDWGRLFAYAAACFGTFMTTFATTLNNHTPAACTTLFAVYPLLMWRSEGKPTFAAVAV